MADRYTRADVARILANVNAAAERLDMAGAGSYAVETMGGSYLYLTDRSVREPDRPTAPGRRMYDLGSTWHRAGEALLTLLQAWNVVELQRIEQRIQRMNERKG